MQPFSVVSLQTGMTENKANIYQQGCVLLIDKPLRWTSFDVVRKVRNLVKAKTGHAGTLDPLASGLLILCTGRFTRKISEYQKQEKEYTATFILGAVTPTYDLESAPEKFSSIETLSEDQLRETALQFTGPQMQVPPAHSAIKRQGKPLYELARKGVDVQPDPRPIEIFEFEVTGIRLPEVDVRVVCSTGTYIRSLAHDFGQALGCGAYLSALCRIRIGTFALHDAISVEQLAEKYAKEKEAQKG